MANTIINSKYKLDIVKYRKLWLWITTCVLMPCIIAVIYLMTTQSNHAPLKLGIDFTGGTILQYSVDKKIGVDEIAKIRTQLASTGIK